MSSEIYDALIIGAGPAGLAAATSLGRACRRVAVFDSQEYRNEKAKEMHNVVLHDGQNPAEFRSQAIAQISSKYPTVIFFDTEVTDAAVLTPSKLATKFQITVNRGRQFEGKKLLLASGCRDILPDIPGYADLWGNGILHCLFRDAYEQKDGSVGVLGLASLQDITSTLMACHMSNKSVTIFLNGEIPKSDEEQKALRIATARGCHVDHKVISRLSRHAQGVCLEFQDGSQDVVRFLMHTPKAVNRAASLISSLGLQLARDALHVQATNSVAETNVRGCFAAGDTATAAKVVAVALATGTMAGIGAARQLAQDEGCQKVL